MAAQPTRDIILVKLQKVHLIPCTLPYRIHNNIITFASNKIKSKKYAENTQRTHITTATADATHFVALAKDFNCNKKGTAVGGGGWEVDNTEGLCRDAYV